MSQKKQQHQVTERPVHSGSLGELERLPTAEN